MINFSTLQDLTIPEGVVTQIADASGRVLWALSGGKVILEVEKSLPTPMQVKQPILVSSLFF